VTIDERTRHQLFTALEQALGQQMADALMEHLPPVGWADVATKHDLTQLEERLHMRFDMRFERTDSRLAAVEERMDLRFAAVDRRFDELEDRIGLRFAATDSRIDAMGAELRGEFQRDLRLQGGAIFAGLSVMMGLFTALGRLL
jgi:hypothetical protein